jgi:hypothetical protein
MGLTTGIVVLILGNTLLVLSLPRRANPALGAIGLWSSNNPRIVLGAHGVRRGFHHRLHLRDDVRTA